LAAVSSEPRSSFYLCLAEAVVFLGQANVVEDYFSALFGLIDILHQVDAQNFVSAMSGGFECSRGGWNGFLGFFLECFVRVFNSKKIYEKTRKKFDKIQFHG
jgi:hypothetical protein